MLNEPSRTDLFVSDLNGTYVVGMTKRNTASELCANGRCNSSFERYKDMSLPSLRRPPIYVHGDNLTAPFDHSQLPNALNLHQITKVRYLTPGGQNTCRRSQRVPYWLSRKASDGKALRDAGRSESDVNTEATWVCITSLIAFVEN